MLKALIIGTGLVLLFALFLRRCGRAQATHRRQTKLDAAFQRAQNSRIQRPQTLYGERAWLTGSSRNASDHRY